MEAVWGFFYMTKRELCMRQLTAVLRWLFLHYFSPQTKCPQQRLHYMILGTIFREVFQDSR